MPETLTRGWLPYEIAFDPRPALVTEAAVRWIELGDAPLAEPFLDDTVRRLKGSSPPARVVETGIDAMVRFAGALPTVTPTGLIFHISRCGSTLIANAMKTAAGVTVVSESHPLTRILAVRADSCGPYLAARWERRRRTLVEALFTLFAHYRTGEPERLVIKFTSVNILAIALVRSWWPDVPCVISVRDPAEVIVAGMKDGVFPSVKANPELAQEVFGWSAPDLGDEEFCARGIAQFLQAALEAVDDRCKVVDYEDLNPAGMRDIAAFLGLDLPETPAAIDDIFTVYSKDPTRRHRFESDRPRKQKQITPAIRGAARQCLPLYTELRSRGAW